MISDRIRSVDNNLPVGENPGTSEPTNPDPGGIGGDPGVEIPGETPPDQSTNTTVNIKDPEGKELDPAEEFPDEEPPYNGDDAIPEPGDFTGSDPDNPDDVSPGSNPPAPTDDQLVFALFSDRYAISVDNGAEWRVSSKFWDNATYSASYDKKIAVCTSDGLIYKSLDFGRTFSVALDTSDNFKKIITGDGYWVFVGSNNIYFSDNLETFSSESINSFTGRAQGNYNSVVDISRLKNSWCAILQNSNGTCAFFSNDIRMGQLQSMSDFEDNILNNIDGYLSNLILGDPVPWDPSLVTGPFAEYLGIINGDFSQGGVISGSSTIPGWKSRSQLNPESVEAGNAEVLGGELEVYNGLSWSSTGATQHTFQRVPFDSNDYGSIDDGLMNVTLSCDIRNVNVSSNVDASLYLRFFAGNPDLKSSTTGTVNTNFTQYPSVQRVFLDGNVPIGSTGVEIVLRTRTVGTSGGPSTRKIRFDNVQLSFYADGISGNTRQSDPYSELTVTNQSVDVDYLASSINDIDGTLTGLYRLRYNEVSNTIRHDFIFSGPYGDVIYTGYGSNSATDFDHNGEVNYICELNIDDSTFYDTAFDGGIIEILFPDGWHIPESGDETVEVEFNTTDGNLVIGSAVAVGNDLESYLITDADWIDISFHQSTADFAGILYHVWSDRFIAITKTPIHQLGEIEILYSSDGGLNWLTSTNPLRDFNGALTGDPMLFVKQAGRRCWIARGRAYPVGTYDLAYSDDVGVSWIPTVSFPYQIKNLHSISKYGA